MFYTKYIDDFHKFQVQSEIWSPKRFRIIELWFYTTKNIKTCQKTDFQKWISESKCTPKNHFLRLGVTIRQTRDEWFTHDLPMTTRVFFFIGLDPAQICWDVSFFGCCSVLEGFKTSKFENFAANREFTAFFNYTFIESSRYMAVELILKSLGFHCWIPRYNSSGLEAYGLHPNENGVGDDQDCSNGFESAASVAKGGGEPWNIEKPPWNCCQGAAHETRQRSSRSKGHFRLCP